MKLKLFGSLLLSFFITQNSYACSSCGSSASAPLILENNENFKMYFGLSQNYNYVNYGVRDGSATHRWQHPGIMTKTTFTYAVGLRTSEKSFITVTQPFVRNEGSDNPSSPYSAGLKSSNMLGDTLISARYNLVNMTIEDEFVPQVQLVGSYKPKIARNMIDNEADSVTTTGNGFHQLTAGVDFWWGMPWLLFGGTQTVTYSFDRNLNKVTVNPTNNIAFTTNKRTRELQYTTVLTIGHSFKEYNFMLQGGVILDSIGKEKTYKTNNVTGEQLTVTGSPAQSNSLFATLNWYLTPADMVRFSYGVGGAYQGDLSIFTNSRQTTSNMALVAYERTFF